MAISPSGVLQVGALDYRQKQLLIWLSP